jgi:hypothetical protein
MWNSEKESSISTNPPAKYLHLLIDVNHPVALCPPNYSGTKLFDNARNRKIRYNLTGKLAGLAGNSLPPVRL